MVLLIANYTVNSQYLFDIVISWALWYS